MSAPPPEPPTLRLVRGGSHAPAAEVERAWFCGYCAARASDEVAILPHARVCPTCGLGLMLQARLDVMPAAGDAFLVVDSRLLVQAVSRRAEEALGISEETWVDQPIGELLLPAAAETDGATELSRLILDTVASDGCARTFVRPRDTFGVRMRARVGSCGPPRAGVVVLDAGAGKPLRAV